MMVNILLVMLTIGVIYWSAFTATFGIHNDYSLLATSATDVLGFIEAKHLMMIGRIIGGLLVSWQGWWTSSVEGFALWRLVGFVLTALAIGFVLRSALIRGLDKKLIPWAFLALIVLPSVNIGFLWAVHVFPGAFNLLISVVAYRLFDRSLNGYRLSQVPFAWQQLLLGVALVFFSLWLYFPTACAFLLMGYVKLLWPKDGEKVIGLWVRDMMFFAFAILIYMVIDRFVIYQWVVSTSSVVNIDPEYTVALAKAPWHKYHLLLDALVVSWQGLWHTFGSSAKWICVGEIFTFFLLMIYGGCRWLNYWSRLFIIVVAAIVLIMITQLPSILAVGMTGIKGYRVFVVPMMVCMLLKIWMIDGLLLQLPVRLLRVMAAAWMLLISLTAYAVVGQVVNRHRTEILTIERAVIQLRSDPAIRTIAIKPARLANDMLDGRVLSEYSYMMSLKQHMQPAFDALCVKYQILPQRYQLHVIGEGEPTPSQPSVLFVDIGETLP